MRSAVIAQLRAHRGDYAVFVAEEYDAYLGRMAREGTWGDHLTLQARPRPRPPRAPPPRATACSLFRPPPAAASQCRGQYERPLQGGARRGADRRVCVQAAADAYGVRLCVLTNYKDSFVIEIEGKKQGSTGGGGAMRVLWLSFWAEVHYNSLYKV